MYLRWRKTSTLNVWLATVCDQEYTGKQRLAAFKDGCAREPDFSDDRSA